jgi:hypothetical protein
MKIRGIKTKLLILLLFLILTIMVFYYLSDKYSINANVVRDPENKLPGKDSLGSYVCEDGALLYLPFDSDLNDQSKNLTKSKSEAVSLFEGKFANSSYFSQNSSLEIPLNFTEEIITLSFWLKNLNNSETSTKFLEINSNNNSVLSISYPNKVLISYKINPTIAAFIDNNWHNIIILINSKEGKLDSFLDGSFLGSKHISEGKISATLLKLGEGNFKGNIDDLIIYNFALDHNNILDIYNNGSGKSACMFIPECVDSDEGINQYEKGIVFTKKESKEDYCLLEGETLKYVNEYYCQGNQIVSKVMDCPKNCFNGACVR